MTNTNQKKNIPPIVPIAIGLGMILGMWQLKGVWQSSQLTPQSSKSEVSPELISSVPNVPAGTFGYGGSTTWATGRKEVDGAIRFSFPKFKLEYIHPASGNSSTSRGIELLLQGKLDFVQSSKGIPADLQQQATQKGIKLTEVPIVNDMLAVAVHPSLNIPGLTVGQLQGIQSGKVNNWRELGGADVPIHIYASSAEELSGAGVPFTKIANSTDAFGKVASDPAGIHFGSSGTLTVAQCGVKTLPIGMSLDRLVMPYQLPIVAPADCSTQRHNQINPDLLKQGYSLLRKLSVVIVADGGVRQQAGEAYAKMLLTTQGQALMRQAGYLNLK